MPHAFDGARHRILSEWERGFLRASPLRNQLYRV
jgi:hypothetical protein